MRKHIVSIFIMMLLFFGTFASALEFDVERHPNGLPKKTRISGEIKAGDFDKFVAFIQTTSSVTGMPDAMVSLATIELASSGGNVLEAMKIASKLKMFYPLISVEDTCASSCLLLWLAGAQRFVGLAGNPNKTGRIGVHRPTLSADDLQSTPISKLEPIFKQMNSSFKEFVLEQGLPISIYERLIATSSTEIYWLNNDDLRLIGSSPSYFSEKIRASCFKLGEQFFDRGKGDNDKRALVNCMYGLTWTERVLAVDSLLGRSKPTGWDNYKKRLLEP